MSVMLLLIKADQDCSDFLSYLSMKSFCMQRVKINIYSKSESSIIYCKAAAEKLTYYQKDVQNYYEM